MKKWFLIIVLFIIALHPVNAQIILGHPANEVYPGTFNPGYYRMSGNLTINDGKLGVNNTDPQHTIHVIGTIRASDDICTELNGLKCLSSVAGGSSQWAASGNNIYNLNTGNVGIGLPNPIHKLDVNGEVRWGDTARQGLLSWTGSPAYMTMGSLSAHNLAIVAGGSEKIRVETSGYIGIGTTSPNSKLEVNQHTRGENNLGVATVYGVLESQGGTPNSLTDVAGKNGLILRHTSWGLVATDAGKRYQLYLENNNGDLRFRGDDGNDKVTFMQSGYAGIGTPNPQAKLEVSGSSAGNPSTLKLTNTGIGGKTYQLGEVLTAGDFEVYDSAVGSRFTIRSDGRVGIGTTNPLQKLAVAGNISFGQGVILGHSTGTNSVCKSGSASLMRKWSAYNCPGNGCGGCTTAAEWSVNAPTCSYVLFDGGTGSCSATGTCTANSWTEVICLGN